MTSEFFDFSELEAQNAIREPRMVHELSDYARTYVLRDKRLVKIEFDDTYEWISIATPNNEKVGEFEFTLIDDDYLLLRRAYMTLADSSYKRMGIGRAAFKFFTENCPYPICARSNDGITHSDGSHLTEDAPKFVATMIREGYIVDCENQTEEYEK